MNITMLITLFFIVWLTYNIEKQAEDGYKLY